MKPLYECFHAHLYYLSTVWTCESLCISIFITSPVMVERYQTPGPLALPEELNGRVIFPHVTPAGRRSRGLAKDVSNKKKKDIFT